MIPGEIGLPMVNCHSTKAVRRYKWLLPNTGDRLIQIGSHYHFFETNPALQFDRAATRGFRLDIPLAALRCVSNRPDPARSCWWHTRAPPCVWFPWRCDGPVR